MGAFTDIGYRVISPGKRQMLIDGANDLYERYLEWEDFHSMYFETSRWQAAYGMP